MCVLRDIKTAGIQQASRNLGRFAGILVAVTSFGTLRLIVRKLTWIGPERTGRSAATGGNPALRRRHR
jgi:hypothetical protein